MGSTAIKTNFMPDGLTHVVNGKERFILDSEDNLTLQNYLREGMALPSSDDAMKATFYLNDDQLKDFKDLQKAFGDIKNHCTIFHDVTYKDTVNLASDIVHCSFEIEGYLGNIIDLVNLFLDGNLSEESAESQISGLLELLIKNIGKYAETGQKVSKSVDDFANETKADDVSMNGSSTTPGLAKIYTDKYGLNNEDIKKLNDDIKEATRELEETTKKYNHDVVVAATTPTYVWVYPFGTIPAAIVAGVYGKRATDAYKKMKDLEEEIKTKTQELQQKTALIAGLALATQQTKEIGDLIKAAIKPIEQIQNCWNSLSSDLSDILKTVQVDIKEAALAIKKVPAQIAIDKWKDVADLANDYRNRAFITSVTETMAVNNIIQFPARNKIS